MFPVDAFIPGAFVRTVRFMKTFLEIATGAALMALWAVAVMATTESTAQAARVAAKPAVVSSAPQR